MTDPQSSSNSKESVSTTAIPSKPITSQKRPRLGYLRSAWTTTDLYYTNSFHSSTAGEENVEQEEDEDGEGQETDDEEQQQEEENFYDIKLPSIQLHDYEDETAPEQEKDEIIQEIFRMITVANVLCLSASLVECGFVMMHGMPAGSLHQVIQHYQDWMPYAILPLYTLWWLFMILVLKNRTEHLRQYLNWTQASAIVMASTNLMLPIERFYPLLQQQLHTLLVALAMLAACIFAFAKRIWIANERKQERLKSRMTREHGKLQAYLDQHTVAFSHHRLAFLNTVSQEIQDVALMVITTLEQFSPAFILSNTHELLSACSLAVPIASISAINTTIRQVCHVSSHLQLLSKLTVQAWTSTTASNSPAVARIAAASLQLPQLNKAEFDIGDLLQNMGDALAGVASKLDVNLVIYHCDNSLHHTLVMGDEGAIRHALLNHLRNVLECCTPGACIEVGLNVTDTAKDNDNEDKDMCKITFYITHTSSPAIRNASAALLPNANLTAQLLQYIHAHCTVSSVDDTSSSAAASSHQTKFEFAFDLARGNKSNTAKRDSSKMFFTKDSYLLKNHYANIKFANEPSLKDLEKFIQHLKGLKMVLHAPEQSIFAKHLTSCLASWNTDISHVPVAQRTTTTTTTTTTTAMDAMESSSSTSSSCVSSVATTPLADSATTTAPRPPSTPPVPSPAIEEEHIHSIPPAFILIDDDVATLESKLAEFRSQPAASANVLQAHHGSRRAAAQAAANHHHPHYHSQHHHPQHSKKSSLSSSPQNFFHQGTTAIIHFTSLTKYKAVRDTIQCYAFLPSRDPFSMPRVVVVPKPAGPRRFLTALHTAWHNSVVEPHFSAIATSPSSPMPPVISMLVQRELAAAAVSSHKGHAMNATSPNEASRISPNDMSPGSGNNQQQQQRSNHRRPLSGLFSPPSNVPPPTSSSSSPSLPPPANGDTYFTLQDQQLTTPPTTTTTASTSRRRSANAQPEPDYLTAKPTTPLMNALGVVSTSSTTTSPAAAIAAASIAAAAAASEMDMDMDSIAINSNSSGNTLDSISTASPSMALPAAAVTIDAMATHPTEQAPVLTTDSMDSSNSNSNATDTTKPRKILSKTMTNFKLNKKKKKAKGTPFADVVSPPINVLIVEDNIINQAILSAWMKKHKIKFSVASNGKEAVDKWKSGGFHLILMDIQLPVMNGIEATKMIRSIEKEQQIGVLPMSSSFLRQQQQQQEQQEPLEVVAAAAAAVSEMKLQESNSNTTKNEDKPSIFRSPVIIVALTASSLESDRHAALAAGCNDFLTKPVSLEWLEKKIIEWGCMQALIDFEGWRRWKRNTNTSDDNNKMAKLTPTINNNNINNTNNQIQAERKRIEALSKKKNVPGVLLPGVSNLTKNARRSTMVSQMDDTSSKRRKKPTLKPSKSDSDTQHVVSSSSSSSSRMMKRHHHTTTASQSETTTTTTTAATGSVPLDRSRSTSKERRFDNDN